MGQKQSRTSIIILSVGIAASLVYLVSQGPSLEFWKKKLGLFATSQEKVVSAVQPLVAQDQPQVMVKPGGGESGQDDVLTLNEKGVGLILKKKYWEGMFLFEKAIQLDPGRIVPIYNMSVTLTEIEMFRSAKRYLEMARKIDPNHQLLREKTQGGLAISNAKNPVRIVPMTVEDSLNM